MNYERNYLSSCLVRSRRDAGSRVIRSPIVTYCYKATLIGCDDSDRLWEKVGSKHDVIIEDFRIREKREGRSCV